MGEGREGAEEAEHIDIESDDFDPGDMDETLALAVQLTRDEAESDDEGAAEQAEPGTQVTKPERGKADAQQQAAQQQPSPEGGAETVDPPSRFTARQKELFAQAPRELQQGYAQAIKDLQSQYTKQVYNLNRERGEIGGIREAIKPLSAELRRRGLTESQGITALSQAHLDSVSDDPEVRLKQLTKQFSKNDIFEAAKRLGGGGSQNGSAGGQQADISQHPEYVGLKQRLDQVTSWMTETQTQQTSAQAETFVQELQTVINEKDAQGRYLYPELHDADFRERAKPFVIQLGQTSPDLSFGDRLKRVTLMFRGQTSPQGDLNRAPGTELQPQNGQQSTPRAQPISVRGKATPTSGGMLTPDAAEIPDDVDGTVDYVARMMREGHM